MHECVTGSTVSFLIAVVIVIVVVAAATVERAIIKAIKKVREE